MNKSLPPPDGYDEQGEPVWTLESIAQHFGLSPEQAEKSIAAFIQGREQELVDPGRITRMN